MTTQQETLYKPTPYSQRKIFRNGCLFGVLVGIAYSMITRSKLDWLNLGSRTLILAAAVGVITGLLFLAASRSRGHLPNNGKRVFIALGIFIWMASILLVLQVVVWALLAFVPVLVRVFMLDYADDKAKWLAKIEAAEHPYEVHVPHD